jgi:fructose-1,6-bisphosphatase/inositol monophosphatase family enzyme
MKDIDSKKIEDIIRHVAATEVMPRFNNLQKSDIREKNPGDFVTVADEASERVFTKLLVEALPGSLVVGEEAVSKDISVLDRFKGDKPVWVIDPIDGTYNFSHGSKKFGILISLVQNGATQYGWAFDAPGNRMAVAQRGAGTFLDGKRMKVNCTATEFKQLCGRGGGLAKILQSPFKEIFNQRCSLHDFMDFITGATDFITHRPKVTPWDHAACCLLAEEAGGYVAMNETEIPYDPTLLGPAHLLIAPDKEWWQKLFPVVQPHARRA